MTDDETVVGTVGSCCDIWRKFMLTADWFQWRNRCTGTAGAWESTIDISREKAIRDGNCSPAARIWLILRNSVTKEQISDARVCIGLMCHDTLAEGETYLGQYAYGVYGLTAARTGYNTLNETITLNHRISSHTRTHPDRHSRDRGRMRQVP